MIQESPLTTGEDVKNFTKDVLHFFRRVYCLNKFCHAKLLINSQLSPDAIDNDAEHMIG